MFISGSSVSCSLFVRLPDSLHCVRCSEYFLCKAKAEEKTFPSHTSKEPFFFAPSPFLLFRRRCKAFRKYRRNFSQASFAVLAETTKTNSKHLFLNTYKTNSVVIIHFQVPGHWQLLPKPRIQLSSGIQYSRTDSENCL